MTEAPISPLRRRMIEDMTIRKFAPRTQEGYIRAVKGFSAFLGASPDRASFEDLRRYQLHLVASGAGTPTINHTGPRNRRQPVNRGPDRAPASSWRDRRAIGWPASIIGAENRDGGPTATPRDSRQYQARGSPHHPPIKKAGGQARMPFNVTGQPGLVIPAGFSKDGLPLSLQDRV
jgi:Phage integrase, N-terminal SAM-like domain